MEVTCYLKKIYCVYENVAISNLKEILEGYASGMIVIDPTHLFI